MTLAEDTEVDENIEFIEAIEPSSLEWFRSRMPLLILLQAFFEEPNNRSEFGFRDGIMTPSARECESELWDLVQLAEKWAERLYDFDDPNAREIAARLRVLSDRKVRPRFEYAYGRR